MSNRFADIAFTPTVKKVQEEMGSRKSYSRMESMEEATNHRLTEAETSFLAARDSLYMATVGETGWPYVQHRGGPPGFVRVLDEGTIGFADFRGNRQYVSVGNLLADDRVSVFFMDYPNKRRLKLFGRAKIVGHEDMDLMSRLEMPDYGAKVERGFIIGIDGFDWNCPQHIVERYTLDDVRALTMQMATRIEELEAKLKQHIPCPGGDA